MTTSKFYIKSLVIFLSVFIVISISYLYIIKKQEEKLKNLVEYHTRMVESGSISSLVKLGEMYEKGEGVEKDLVRAKELFKKAINFNKYLDEIYPTHTKSDIPEDNNKNLNYADDDTIKIDLESDDALSSISYPESGLTSTDITDSDSVSRSNTPLEGDLTNKTKFIPYIKKNKTASKEIQSKDNKDTPFKNVILVKENKSTIEKSDKKTTKIKTKVAIKKPTKSTKKIAKAKKSPKIKPKNKRKKKPRKKSTVKKRKIKKKKIAKKKTKKRNRKTKFKKTVVLKKASSKSKVKKTRLEAKRAPRLNEERPDIQNELDIYEEKIIAESEKNKAKQKNNSQELESNFTSNPCDTASARYIAKCRRKNRNR